MPRTPEIKREPTIEAGGDVPEGLAPPRVVQIPKDFTEQEWADLTEGFENEQDEINFIIAQRGSGGSRKGRPTGLRVQYQGQLSNTARAIAQRDLAASRTEEEAALQRAKDSDRAARAKFLKSLKEKEWYKTAGGDEKDGIIKSHLEEHESKRFEEKRSADWMASALQAVHAKWSKIQNEIDKRRHQHILQTTASDAPSDTSTQGLRLSARLYGRKGVVDSLIRKEYLRGLAKLNNNAFESEQARDEWLKKEEPASILDQFNPDTRLEDNKPYIEGYGSDECEEELDDEDKIIDENKDGYKEAEDQDEEAEEEKSEQFWLSKHISDNALVVRV
ncbi:uncharacterized protein SETTUDRAFT_24621 [Exserohilum turcica Et28A]|uniref:Uncharacterized protein n=1 Tax=Exserohilum turcicum (strain 28A) TaxID=671987 RepID=R0JUE4_EXST2|nr:uncharacterized protein SETTUDRAFT_24621 [Exserohilum turcica Et28A]EOA81119.1 hypothetical protein SETTUDRAFT_24621 [Exserohilum turcica Et28A]